MHAINAQLWGKQSGLFNNVLKEKFSAMETKLYHKRFTGADWLNPAQVEVSLQNLYLIFRII